MQVVGFFEGKVGLNTSGARILGVVSERPIVLGSTKGPHLGHGPNLTFAYTHLQSS